MHNEQNTAYVELTRGNGDIIVWEIVTPSNVVGRRFDLIESTAYPCAFDELTGEQLAYNACLSFESYVGGLDDRERDEFTQEIRDAMELNREVLHQLNRGLY